MFCKNCGNKVNEEDLFCTKCGFKQNNQNNTINIDNNQNHNTYQKTNSLGKKSNVNLINVSICILSSLNFALPFIIEIYYLFKALFESILEPSAINGWVVILFPMVLVIYIMLLLPQIIVLILSIVNLLTKKNIVTIIMIVVNLIAIFFITAKDFITIMGKNISFVLYLIIYISLNLLLVLKLIFERKE